MFAVHTVDQLVAKPHPRKPQKKLLPRLVWMTHLQPSEREAVRRQRELAHPL
ncbi:MAG TPA: hypothetical protein VGM67_03815 [Gemmatimonadaceae bacterium]